MGKAERKQVVLEFMASNRLALPPRAIFRNLKLHEGITFSEDSVENYLSEFVDEGLVQRVSKEPLDDGEVEAASADERAWYLISEAGIEAADYS